MLQPRHVHGKKQKMRCCQVSSTACHGLCPSERERQEREKERERERERERENERAGERESEREGGDLKQSGAIGVSQKIGAKKQPRHHHRVAAVLGGFALEGIRRVLQTFYAPELDVLSLRVFLVPAGRWVDGSEVVPKPCGFVLPGG